MVDLVRPRQPLAPAESHERSSWRSRAMGEHRGRAASVIAQVAVAAACIELWQHVSFVWSVPTIGMAALAVAAIALRTRRLASLAAAWWLYALASVSWSLAPGATLVAVLWASLYLAGWLAGGRWVLAVASTIVLGSGLLTTLSLQITGLTQYFSGSAHYLTGAAALLVLPIALGAAVQGRSRVLLAVASVAAGVALFAALSSGSRAVYLPLALVLGATVVRVCAGRRKASRLAIALAAAAALTIVGDVTVPGHPVLTALQIKTQATRDQLVKTGPSRDLAGAGEGSAFRPTPARPSIEGAIASRLAMWRQTARIGLRHPLGVGAGSFRDTIQGFQIYPTVNFNSAHNVVLEVFATEGWPGAVLLLLLIGLSLTTGWRDDSRWMFAVGSAGLWLSMCFDITWSMPVIPLLAFWSLGTASEGRPRGARPVPARTLRSLRWLRPVTLVLAAAVVAWWYLPGDPESRSTVLVRHQGLRPEAVAAIRQIPADERPEWIRSLKELYPRSLWVWSLELDQATNDAERLAGLRAIAARFPLSSPTVYADWAMLALREGSVDEARTALAHGLQAFPVDLAPAGVPLQDRSRAYAAWIAEAARLESELER